MRAAPLAFLRAFGIVCIAGEILLQSVKGVSMTRKHYKELAENLGKQIAAEANNHPAGDSMAGWRMAEMVADTLGTMSSFFRADLFMVAVARSYTEQLKILQG